jgi:serine/threonine-protein kinase PknG
VKCPEPGCPGEIDDDGYCTVTGMKVGGITAGTSASASAPTGSSPYRSTAGTASARTGITRRRTETSRTTTARRLDELVEIEPVPKRDPLEAILPDDYQLPESKRFCATCDAPVGRSDDGESGRTEGYCRKCGHAFSFTPKLSRGDAVAGQYEVVGRVAHGGLGWIYLARDLKVDQRWVVLKGLLDTTDADALAAAIAERRFLAQVGHEKIVKIYNFTEHKGDGYIVMEYVDGRSLRQTLEDRRAANNDTSDPLPVKDAIKYMLEILPALGYLHSNGLLFCDFKPDNVIRTGASVKLIDLGGVHRIGDEESSIYGTPGYQAPEVSEIGPSVSSDLYTVGRTLAVLCTVFRGFTNEKTYQYSLPPVDDVPLYAQYDSLYRLLERATARDPDDRFQSVDEMTAQLYGVLREIVARETGTTRPAASTLFTGELRGLLDRPDWHRLPTPIVDSEDPAAGALAILSIVTDPVDVLEQLAGIAERTVEVQLREARAAIDAGRFDHAERVLTEVSEANPWEWRASWYRGLGFLAVGEPSAAMEEFRVVYMTLPGELAPKLALAYAAESNERFDVAAQWYDIVSTTDHNFPTAAFGLARCRVATGDRAGAINAYDRVPETSIAYTEAQKAKAHLLLDHDGRGPDVADVIAAGAVVDRLSLGGEGHARLVSEVLGAALDVVQGDGLPDPPPLVLGRPLTEDDVRLGLEETFRTLARLAPTGAERITFVDRANRVRPRTLT